MGHLMVYLIGCILSSSIVGMGNQWIFLGFWQPNDPSRTVQQSNVVSAIGSSKSPSSMDVMA